VIIHKEGNNKHWETIYSFTQVKQTITTLSFNPFTNINNSLQLIVSYSDGSMHYINYFHDTWNTKEYTSHPFGMTNLTWLPVSADSNESISAFITAGNDCQLKYWEISNKELIEEKDVLEKVHNSSVFNIECFSSESTSSVKQDSLITLDIDDEIYLWAISRNTNNKLYEFNKPEPVKFSQDQKPSGISQVTWSKCGAFLSISTQEGMYLYRNVEKEWTLVSSMNNEGVMVNYEEEN